MKYFRSTKASSEVCEREVQIWRTFSNHGAVWSWQEQPPKRCFWLQVSRQFSVAVADYSKYGSKPVWGNAMAQTVSSRPLTAAAWVRAQVNPVGFVVVALRQVFLRVLQFSPVNIHFSEN
jgi:hypothetical protein